MRGRVVPLFFLVLLLLSDTAISQCSYVPIFSGPFRSTAFDLAVDGNDLWVATGYGAELRDRSVDPPALVASIPIPNLTRNVRALGGYAYAGSGAALFVLRRNGRTIQLLRTVTLPGSVNDLAITPGALYAATSAGLFALDLLDPSSPSLVAAPLATSNGNVNTLAINAASLFAADGDSSVETFSINQPARPQPSGSITSLARSLYVRNAGSSKLFISDGQQTDLVLLSNSPTHVPVAAGGTTSLAALTNDVVFVAGNDRRLRAVDYAISGSPVDLFTIDLPPTAGTINRISGLQVVAGRRLYVAGGDLGLLTFDISGFTAPFPVRSYPTGAVTSILALGNKVYTTPADGGISELLQSSGGQLTPSRHWDTNPDILRDASSNGLLLTSSGRSVTYWTLASTVPAAISSVSFPSAVQSAVLTGSRVYAVADRKLWTADLSLQNPVAGLVSLPAGINPSFIARSGPAIAITDLRDDATTSVSFFPTTDFSRAPSAVKLPGIATAAPALGGSIAAVFTFQGLSVVDFASQNPVATVLPQSNSRFAKSLAISGATLFEVADDQLLVWDLRTSTLSRQLALPDEAVAVHAAQDVQSDFVQVATVRGEASVSYRTASMNPALVPVTNGNLYYRKALANAAHVYLFEGRAVDIFSTTSTAPHSIASVRPPGIIDFAVAADAFYTLSNSSQITAWSVEGSQLAQVTLNEGSDAQPLAITAVNGVPWISLIRGCRTGGCQNVTLVLDPVSLIKTATLEGNIIEASVSGRRAFALFDVPAEVRSYDLTDQLHPTLIASRRTEGARTPVSIAAANGVVSVLGERLYLYDENLVKKGERFGDFASDATGPVSYVDQRVRVDGICSVVTGRSLSPSISSPSATPVNPSPFSAPAPIRSFALQNGRLLLLTDDSLEILSTSGMAPPQRRRATR